MNSQTHKHARQIPISSEAQLLYFPSLGCSYGFGPILATIGLGLLVILPSGYVFLLLTKDMSMESRPWLAMLVNHALMLVIALVTDRLVQQRTPL